MRLDRGAGAVAAAVAADGAVQRERSALMDYLRGGYRDPLSARARLDELVKREGWTSATARIAREPEQLGELRGRLGFFAGVAARQEREAAIGAMTAGKDEGARVTAWRAAQADAGLSVELKVFGAGIEQRFGADNARAMLRAECRAGAVTLPGASREMQGVVDRVAQLAAGLRQGERAGVKPAEAERLAQRQSLRQGPRLRM